MAQKTETVLNITAPSQETNTLIITTYPPTPFHSFHTPGPAHYTFFFLSAIAINPPSYRSLKLK